MNIMDYSSNESPAMDAIRRWVGGNRQTRRTLVRYEIIKTRYDN